MSSLYENCPACGATLTKEEKESYVKNGYSGRAHCAKCLQDSTLRDFLLDSDEDKELRRSSVGKLLDNLRNKKNKPAISSDGSGEDSKAVTTIESVSKEEALRRDRAECTQRALAKKKKEENQKKATVQAKKAENRRARKAREREVKRNSSYDSSEGDDNTTLLVGIFSHSHFKSVLRNALGQFANRIFAPIEEHGLMEVNGSFLKQYCPHLIDKPEGVIYEKVVARWVLSILNDREVFQVYKKNRKELESELGL